MTKETITVQIQVAIEYNEGKEGAREYIVDYATKNLHMKMSGCGDIGYYSAEAIKGSGKVIESKEESI